MRWYGSNTKLHCFPHPTPHLLGNSISSVLVIEYVTVSSIYWVGRWTLSTSVSNFGNDLTFTLKTSSSYKKNLCLKICIHWRIILTNICNVWTLSQALEIFSLTHLYCKCENLWKCNLQYLTLFYHFPRLFDIQCTTYDSNVCTYVTPSILFFLLIIIMLGISPTPFYGLNQLIINNFLNPTPIFQYHQMFEFVWNCLRLFADLGRQINDVCEHLMHFQTSGSSVRYVSLGWIWKN